MLTFLVLLVSGHLRRPAELLKEPDIWWHLADARILSETHHFITVEPYSFSVAGERWVNPEWLAEMPFWAGYRSLGLTGIYLISILGLCANLIIVYWRSYWKAQHWGAAFWMAVLGYLLMTPNSGPRTIMIAYLAMSAEMAILEAAERGRTGLLWFLPPLFCVWINLHGSWVVGLALFCIYILGGLFPFKMGAFAQDAFSSKIRNRLVKVLVASVAALFINPYGWRLIWNPFDLMFNQKLMTANVQEWKPLNLTSLTGMGALTAIFLIIVTNCINARKWKVYELMFLFFAWFWAFGHVRFTFLASVVTIPMIAADVARCFCAKQDEKTIPWMNALLIAGAVGVFVYFLPSEASLKKNLAEDYPLQLIASVQPSWRVFDQDSIGGMMDFNAKPTFVDTRWDTFEHHGVLKDYLDILHFAEPLKLLDKYRFDHVLCRQDWPLAYLLERTPGWRIEKSEGPETDLYVLLARDPPAESRQAQSGPVSVQQKH